MKETTILICTPDLNSDITKRCLDSLFKYTCDSLFELIISDNRNSESFNHSREINKCLKNNGTKYLVSLDDDVVLTPGWLEALLEGVDDTTGLVGCVQLNRDGSIRQTGGWISKQAKATHLREWIDRPVFVPYICSSCVLFTRQDLLLSEEYRKYCQESDYCLRIWESGQKVKVVPHYIYHIGNQQMLKKYTREQTIAISNEDSILLAEKWVDTGRIERLYEQCSGNFTFTINDENEYNNEHSEKIFYGESLDDFLSDRSANGNK